MNSVTGIGRAAFVALTVFCALSVDIVGILRDRLGRSDFVTDFAVFWRAAQVDPAIIYDVEALTRAQAVVIGHGDYGLRPFVNPPSMLPWLEPFAAMPYWPAMVLWWGLGVLAFAVAARSLLTWRRALLILIAPSFILIFISGQVSFFVGALVVAGVLALERRPLVAGVLFGVAATIKPQTVVLAPLALIAGGHLRVLGVAVLTGTLVGLGCIAVQGVQLWRDWLGSLDEFLEITKAYFFMRRGATPTNLMYFLGVTGWAEVAFVNAMRLVGLAVGIVTFRFSRDPFVRLTGLIAGGLLLSPYAMPQETVVLLIPAAAWLLSEDYRTWPASFMLISFLLLPLAVILAALTAVLLAVRPRKMEADAGGPLSLREKVPT